MKKMLKKMGLVVLMMALTGNVVVAAIAEEETPAPAPVVVEAPAPVEQAPAPAAEEKASEPTPAPAPEAPAPEAPAPEAPAPEAPAPEAPAPEAPAPEAPAAETSTEPTEAPAAEATEAPAEEPTAEPTAEPTPFAFTGTVTVKLDNDGDIFLGDKVTLRVEVRDANADYEIRWEYSKGGDDWKTISGETSKTYSFTVTEENAEYAYRAVLVVAE